MKRATFAVCLVAGLTAVPVVAMASDDGPSMEQSFIRSMLGGIGIIETDKPKIEYRERAPLVVPGNREALPAPQDSAAARNPAWPNDPDAARARRAAALDNAIATPGAGGTNRALSQKELREGATAGSGRVDRPSTDLNTTLATTYTRELVTQPTFGGKLSQMLGREEQKEIVFTGEPPRERLVEPPAGFRTPSASQPYGPTGKKVDDKTVLEQRKASGPIR